MKPTSAEFWSNSSPYTVKRYHSTKQVHEDRWTHQTIELQPLNPDPTYQPIPINEEDAESIRVVGEFVGIIVKGEA